MAEEHKHEEHEEHKHPKPMDDSGDKPPAGAKKGSTKWSDWAKTHKIELISLGVGILGVVLFLVFKSKSSSSTTAASTTPTSSTDTGTGNPYWGSGGGGGGNSGGNGYVPPWLQPPNPSTPTSPTSPTNPAPATSVPGSGPDTTVTTPLTITTPPPPAPTPAPLPTAPATYAVTTAQGQSVSLPSTPQTVVAGQTVNVPASQVTSPAVMQQVATAITSVQAPGNPISNVVSGLDVAQTNPNLAQADLANAAKETGPTYTAPNGQTYSNYQVYEENVAAGMTKPATTTPAKKPATTTQTKVAAAAPKATSPSPGTKKTPA